MKYSSFGSLTLLLALIALPGLSNEITTLADNNITSSNVFPLPTHTKDKNTLQLNSFYEFDYVSVEFNASYSDTVISNTAPVINIQDNIQAYYLQSKISIPSSDHFNIAMTASFNQLEEGYGSFQQIPLTKSFFIIENNQSAHYGLIGNYLFTPSWEITGGIIHSLPLIQSTTTEANNLAIIGTTYHF